MPNADGNAPAAPNPTEKNMPRPAHPRTPTTRAAKRPSRKP